MGWLGWVQISLRKKNWKIVSKLSCTSIDFFYRVRPGPVSDWFQKRRSDRGEWVGLALSSFILGFCFKFARTPKAN